MRVLIQEVQVFSLSAYRASTQLAKTTTPGRWSFPDKKPRTSAQSPNESTNYPRRTRGHGTTKLSVKEDIEDVSSELGIEG
ncbi:UNVERIFIED_CONTAM: hypothetical protein NCL1_23856 [Trichonephila clavipes]